MDPEPCSKSPKHRPPAPRPPPGKPGTAPDPWKRERVPKKPRGVFGPQTYAFICKGIENEQAGGETKKKGRRRGRKER
eukprot:9325594-Pyramimonas_sp.AAC.1